ncbi:DUF3311 domain-containing protein [Acidisoma silvae]|uniref:DUF3311 domain-containing protein n=1 Tax=Acidisoma silvae TaxID=2802396 RepID=A0A963YPC1_9PROT|nr:DUF3311 domain-containing protein [Acidisoma silvae]MCB8874693.1 DUF3311 domain-containing protein [Acidisoma silvae]
MPQPTRRRASFWRVLLILPILAVIAVGCFNSTGPSLWGFPFFYWYQMLWVLLCSAIVGLVFFIEGPSADAGDDA